MKFVLVYQSVFREGRHVYKAVGPFDTMEAALEWDTQFRFDTILPIPPCVVETMLVLEK